MASAGPAGASTPLLSEARPKARRETREHTLEHRDATTRPCRHQVALLMLPAMAVAMLRRREDYLGTH